MSDGFLQLLGFYPAASLAFRRRKRERLLSRRGAANAVLRGLALGAAALNAYFCYETFKTAKSFHKYFGLLHSMTVCMLVLSIKPLINALNLLIFVWEQRRHAALLCALDSLEAEWRASFGVRTRLRPRNAAFIATAAVVFVVSAVGRCVEHWTIGRARLTEILFGLALPILQVWCVTPVLYFISIQSILRGLSRTLWHQIADSGPSASPEALGLFYQKFLRLCTLQSKVCDLFGPWIFVSYAWSLFTLCLTIYFLTQVPSGDINRIPESVIREAGPGGLAHLMNVLTILQVWAMVQITFAFLHISAICFMGTKTNEETRKILRSVLSVAPAGGQPTPEVSYFVYKMSTQYYWGVNVWRAFPIERGVFFTLISIILTYAILLFKFRDSTISAEKLASQRTIIGLNETFVDALRNVTQSKNS